MKTDLCTVQKQVPIYKPGRNYVYSRNPDSIVLYLECSTNRVLYKYQKPDIQILRVEEKIFLRIALSPTLGHQLHAQIFLFQPPLFNIDLCSFVEDKFREKVQSS